MSGVPYRVAKELFGLRPTAPQHSNALNPSVQLRKNGMRILNALVFVCMTIALAFASPAQAQLKPLDVEHDPNGVDLLSGAIVTRLPELSVPASSHLRMSKIQDIMPFLSGTLVANSNKSNYDINNGTQTSEHFDCTDDECLSKKKTGGTLIASPSSKTFDYYQGGTATHIHFDLQNFYQDILVGGIGFSFYASYIQYTTGERLDFTYDTYTGPDGRVYRRPSTISSNLGYRIELTYQAPFLALGYTTVAQAALYKSGVSAPLASLAYSGDTVTDIAGRQFTCVYCGNSLGSSSTSSAMTLRMPGESADAVTAVSASCRSTGYVYMSNVTVDGVSYNYNYTTDPTFCQYPKQVKITAPSLSKTVNIESGANIRPRVTSIISTDEVSHISLTTTYGYDNAVRVNNIIYPENNSTSVTYDGLGRITQSKLTSKSGSDVTYRTAYYPIANACVSYACVCFTAECFMPTWTKDELARQTDYAYNSAGQITQQTDPADSAGVRRQTNITYTTTGVSRKSLVRICGATTSCSGNAESHTEYTYLGNTFLPLTETQVNEATGQSRTTTYAYDDAGRALSVDGPLTGTNDAKYFRYDILGRKTWEIGEAAANGIRIAKRFTYRDSDDKVIKVETGTVTNSADTNLVITEQTDTIYDSRRNPIRETTSAGGMVYRVTDRSFLDRGLAKCTAVRMNLAALPATTADGACALGTAGTQGQDRIVRNYYDGFDRLTKIQKAFGTSLQQDYVAYTYTPNGKQQTVTDANGNKAQYTYDGFDRLTKWAFPDKSVVGSVSATDYEQYNYDLVGNRTFLKKRDGATLTYTYDGLNRVTSKVGSTTGGGGGGGGPNQPPVANTDIASTSACGAVTVNVITNDTDPDGNLPLSVVGIVSATNADVTIQSSTSIKIFTSISSGQATVTYRMTDSLGAMDDGTVLVDVSGGQCP